MMSWGSKSPKRTSLFSNSPLIRELDAGILSKTVREQLTRINTVRTLAEISCLGQAHGFRIPGLCICLEANTRRMGGKDSLEPRCSRSQGYSAALRGKVLISHMFINIDMYLDHTKIKLYIYIYVYVYVRVNMYIHIYDV